MNVFAVKLYFLLVFLTEFAYLPNKNNITPEVMLKKKGQIKILAFLIDT